MARRKTTKALVPVAKATLVPSRFRGGSSLSGWWADEELRPMRAAGENQMRLVFALRAVQAMVRVVDTTVPPLIVEWASEDTDETGRRMSLSATDLKGKRIFINPLPVTDPQGLSETESIDIVSAFGMHEASHSMYSIAPYETLLERDAEGKEHPAVRPLRVAAQLLNVVEDVRIEGLTAEAFPGFAPYFTKALDWMWDRHRDIWPAEYGPTLGSKMQAVIGICKWPDAVASVFTHPSFAAEIPWWTAWQSDYLSGTVGARETVQRGIDHLRLDKETSKEMDALTKQEEAEEAAGESIRRLLDRLAKEGVEGTVAICLNEHGEAEVLTGAEAEQVRKLFRENLTEHKTVITATGAANVPIHVRKPEETGQSQRSYVGKPGATLQRFRSALVFRQDDPEFDIKLLESGTLDETEFWRFASKDYRMFSERVIETKPRTQMSLLVDLSGSMAGSKLRTAQELAQLFAWALIDQPGVETQVFGHTGDSDGTWCDVFRLWEKGDPLSRLGLINTLPHANNYDGHAIAWVAKQLMERGGPEDQRLLVVLSDGLPHGNGYGTHAAMGHVRSVTDWAHRQGVDVLQIAIDSDLVPADQSKMFGSRWIPFTSVDDLPRALARLMASVT